MQLAQPWGRLSRSEHVLLEAFLERVLRAAPGGFARIAVFGSRARAASHEASDLDVALEPIDAAQRRPLQAVAFDAGWDAMEATGLEALMLAPAVVPRAAWGLSAIVRQEGIPIWVAADTRSVAGPMAA